MKSFEERIEELKDSNQKLREKEKKLEAANRRMRATIKELKVANQRLNEKISNEESLTKYKLLFNSIPLGITVTDKKGNIIESNKLAEEILGLSVQEQTQRQIDSQEWRIVGKDGSPMPADEFASVRALKENRLIENVEMGIEKEDNIITWISVSAIPIPSNDLGILIAYNDITHRKKTEEKLIKSEK